MTAEICPNCGWNLDDDVPGDSLEDCSECGMSTDEDDLYDGVCILCLQNRDEN